MKDWTKMMEIKRNFNVIKLRCDDILENNELRWLYDDMDMLCRYNDGDLNKGPAIVVILQS